MTNLIFKKGSINQQTILAFSTKYSSQLHHHSAAKARKYTHCTSTILLISQITTIQIKHEKHIQLEEI